MIAEKIQETLNKLPDDYKTVAEELKNSLVSSSKESLSVMGLILPDELIVNMLFVVPLLLVSGKIDMILSFDLILTFSSIDAILHTRHS